MEILKALQLNTIQKLYFSTSDIARVLGISIESARVTAVRYTQKKILTRLKKDIYVLTERIKYMGDSERFMLANIIQTPSYISLTTALSYNEISTQQQQNYIESVALNRTKLVHVAQLSFSFSKIQPALYDGYVRTEGFFIATPEKALADAVYLAALGRYRCDFHAVNFQKIQKKNVDRFVKKTNTMVVLFWERLCRNFGI